MKKSRYQKKSAKLKKHSSLLSRGSVAILLGVTLAVSFVVISVAFVGSSKRVVASTNPQEAKKRYKATRALMVDEQTGQLRMPTRQEIDETLASLATLSKRPTDGLLQTSAATTRWLLISRAVMAESCWRDQLPMAPGKLNAFSRLRKA